MPLNSDEIAIGRIIFQIPPTDCPADAEVFEKTCRRIVAEHERRETNDRMRWLHDVAYALITRMLEFDGEKLFKDRLTKAGRYPKGQAEHLNPFQPALLAIFAHRPLALDFRRRDWLSKRLWLAYRHFVPEPFLQGFLFQAGSKLTVDTSNAIVPQFRDWVVEHLADPNVDVEYRGVYPADINKAVRKRQKSEARKKASEIGDARVLDSDEKDYWRYVKGW